ncbi:hypothetical protein [Gracilinema caldarium]|uniref:hypothetical protein n=1 Tax=Gracilinema caldarium TaxID=215591 RepID=UPI0026EAF609|nr:hypothetical protein [Gracilinema caldarium]
MKKWSPLGFFVYAAAILCIPSCSNNEITETENATWQVLGSKGTGVVIANAVALALDANGLPVVGVQDSINGTKATVMRFDGTVWGLLGAGAVSDGEAQYVQIAADSSGHPVIAFRDWVHNCKLTVMAYK